MSATLVNSYYGTGIAATVVYITTAPVAGNLLVAWLSGDDGRANLAAASVTDNLGASWDTIGTNGGLDTRGPAGLAFKVATGGETSVTLSDVSGSGRVRVQEFSGFVAVNPADGAGSTAFNVSNNVGASLTASVAPGAMLHYFVAGNGTSLRNFSPWDGETMNVAPVLITESVGVANASNFWRRAFVYEYSSAGTITLTSNVTPTGGGRAGKASRLFKTLAGVTAPTITALSAINITASSAQPRISYS